MARRLLRSDAIMEKTDPDSTLIRRGQSAFSYSDMVVFAETVESRPIGKLLEELPGIAGLSETKFHLAAKVLRQRFRGESPADQLQLRVIADEIAGSVPDGDLALRIRGIFDLSRE